MEYYKEQRLTTTILDLPIELIVYICSRDELKITDIFNLAICHSKLNNFLLLERNSSLWKSKYIQKFGPWDKDEYEIVIDEQNSWKDEIKMRILLDKAVPFEILQMPRKYLKFTHVPYHLYPFSKQLNSKKESHKYYVLNSSSTYYNHLLSNEGLNENYDLLYVAHYYLMYTCRVYFGYKLNDFLNLPPSEQTIERGFYLVDRWLNPTNRTPYCDIDKHLNNIAIKVFNLIGYRNPVHSLLKHTSILDQVVNLGKTNLDNDLFDETSTITILEYLSHVLFTDNYFVSYDEYDINNFLLHQVIEHNKGSVFLLCVIYESVARRLGIKLRLTATSISHRGLYWSPSYLKQKTSTVYFIDITDGGVLSKIRPIPGYMLEHDINMNFICDVRIFFWEFSKNMERLSFGNITIKKYVLDFQNIIKPNDASFYFKYQDFHKYYDYCSCPLLRNALNPNAPRHVGEKLIMYPYFDEIFSSVSKTRGTDNDPTFSIGMMINIKENRSTTSCCEVVMYCGIIVGWTRVLRDKPMPSQALYYVLLRSTHNYGICQYKDPVIKAVLDGREILQRHLTPFNFNHFKSIGKFFKRFSHELSIYIPIDALVDHYPDDLQYATLVN